MSNTNKRIELTKRDKKLINELTKHKGISRKNIPKIARLIYGENTAFNNGGLKTHYKLIKDFCDSKSNKIRSDERLAEINIEKSKEYFDSYYIVTSESLSYVIKSNKTISSDYFYMNGGNKSYYDHFVFYVVNEIGIADIMTVGSLIDRLDIVVDKKNFNSIEELKGILIKIKGFSSVGREKEKLYKQSFNAEIVWKGGDRLNKNILGPFCTIYNNIKYVSEYTHNEMKRVDNKTYSKWDNYSSSEEVMNKMIYFLKED
ncbi:hypothetical protein [Marinomonas sp. TW1]|uniref:hypothetical protein n=1 Tax=Marinomonas sp. TW1 TaxID=1561203 RepID=UPI0007AF8ED5|nr:hypothetical protein [Marinomonas sp. TW1]KZN13945.1 hypothetical protein OA79_07580 [Marinomonas sp. TW1]